LVYLATGSWDDSAWRFTIIVGRRHPNLHLCQKDASWPTPSRSQLPDAGMAASRRDQIAAYMYPRVLSNHLEFPGSSEREETDIQTGEKCISPPENRVSKASRSEQKGGFRLISTEELFAGFFQRSDAENLNERG
jgi:hypothetical protein